VSASNFGSLLSKAARRPRLFSFTTPNPIRIRKGQLRVVAFSTVLVET
jgi:hypothetical protein